MSYSCIIYFRPRKIRGVLPHHRQERRSLSPGVNRPRHSSRTTDRPGLCPPEWGSGTTTTTRTPTCLQDRKKNNFLFRRSKDLWTPKDFMVFTRDSGLTHHSLLRNERKKEGSRALSSTPEVPTDTKINIRHPETERYFLGKNHRFGPRSFIQRSSI